MKAKKPKRRFLTAQQIMEEIDKYKERAVRLQQQAEALEIASRELMKIESMVEDAKFRKSEAARARRSASRILDKKLPQLKAKLAEFLTMKIPGIDNGDSSVST